MFELFTALFTILFTLFAAAAIVGHVLLAQAVMRMLRGTAESGRPAPQPAMPAPMRPAVTGP